MQRRQLICTLALGMAIAPTLFAPLQAATPPTGSQHIDYVFAATGENMPLRYYVPTTWDGMSALPIILMLHGAGADENSYMDRREGQLMQLAEQHGYIVVSPLGHSPLGAYGNPLRLPAVFGQEAVATQQVAAVDATRRRTLALSELEVITALELIIERYGADRSRTFLAGHSMGSGAVWHLAARSPERWRAIAPMSGPFVSRAGYPFERIRGLPILLTEGRGATPSLEGSRALAVFLREQGFNFEYLETDGDHGGMVAEVLPSIFDYFDRYR